MRLPSAFPRRSRWAVPAGAVAAVAAAGVASAITVAQAAPALPARTPAQLLAAMAGRAAPPPLTGTVVETASLGIPQLPGAANPASITSLLSGSHTIRVWYAGPAHFRLAVPVRMGESDLIRNGSTAWLWQSSSNSVAKMQLPRHGAVTFHGALACARLVPPSARLAPHRAKLTPRQARKALARLRVRAPAAVATRCGPVPLPPCILKHLPAKVRKQIQARLVPLPAHPSKSGTQRALACPRVSLHGSAKIPVIRRAARAVPARPGPSLTPQQAAKQALAALGPSTRVSMQSNVTVAGQAAYQLVLAPRDGRSQIGKVTFALDGQHPGVPLRVQVFARGATSPAISIGYTSISFVRPAAANFTFTPPKGAHVTTGPMLGGSYAFAPLSGQKFVPPAAAAAPQVMGKGWLAVAVLPESVVSGLGSGNAASAAGQAARSVAGRGGSVSSGAVAAALLKSARPVHGSWGSGRLLHASLISVLITKGHVLVGAVAPSVLYADAARIK